MGDCLKVENNAISLTNIFNENFPFYMAMGMDYNQYWNENPFLVRAYKKAYELKKEAKEYELWKQGVYVYEAILDASPILHAFAKNGTKARPYPEKPFGLEEYENKETEEEKQRKIENERIKAKVHFMNIKKILEKQFGGQEDGNSSNR